MIELPNTVTEAQAALYAAMRRGTDPRWGAEPVEPPKRRPPLWLWIAGPPMALVVLISIARGAM